MGHLAPGLWHAVHNTHQQADVTLLTLPRVSWYSLTHNRAIIKTNAQESPATPSKHLCATTDVLVDSFFGLN